MKIAVDIEECWQIKSEQPLGSMEWKDSGDISNVNSLPRELYEIQVTAIHRWVCLEIQPSVRSGKSKNSENYPVIGKELGAGMGPSPCVNEQF